VAPELAQKFTVVAPDLRGYGDSSRPPDGENHSGYSKRGMAQDQVEVMEQLGLRRFAVVGHDRGARIEHRMALDHRDSVARLAVLDIVPTYKLYTNVSREFATAYFHWFFLIQSAPLPERLIENSFEEWQKKSRMKSDDRPFYRPVRPLSAVRLAETSWEQVPAENVPPMTRPLTSWQIFSNLQLLSLEVVGPPRSNGDALLFSSDFLSPRPLASEVSR
jgi:pimeloyl-ACP methyl ester carboxylesterase